MRKKIAVASTIALFSVLSMFLWPSSQARETRLPPSQVTFNKDVAPIFYQHCVECHRPGEASPMSLLTYKEARPWARSIREKVVSREMPPWHADPHFGEFSNDRRLTEQAINTIVAWVDGGAKEGDAKDLPTAPQYSSDWKIGKPDLILTMAEEYTLEAQGSDEYIDFVIPTRLAESKWIKAVEIHPGNKQVVHHAIAFIQTPEMAAAAKANAQSKPPADSIFYREGTLQRVKPDAPVYDDGCAAPNGGLAPGSEAEMTGPSLGFYAPGKDIARWPAKGARSLPAGSKIILQMHYSKTTGKVEKDRTSVGLVFAKEPPEITIRSNGGINQYFKIPAGAPNHEVKACYDFRQDTQLLSLMPHMHKRGKAMKYEIVQPDGQRRTLLSVPAYDFNWQTQYTFKAPVFVPKGSRLILTAHYDNSEKNRNNPDPTKVVRWGNPTYDEMLVGYFEYFVTAPERTAVNVSRDILNSYAGAYEVWPGTILTFTLTADGLQVTSSGLPAVPLFAESETKFFLKTVDVQLTFVKGEKGEVTEVLIDRGGRTFRARKIKQPKTPGESR